MSHTSPKRDAIRTAIDWGKLAPLKITARHVSEGVYAGMHRSARRGSGIEFGGYREYTLGDDLRWLDRRSLLRYERLVVRQFETETERAVWLVVDATASMAYRGTTAPAAKLAFASLIAAAITRIALRTGDPIALGYFAADEQTRGVSRSSGREQFERVVASLEHAAPIGDALERPEAVLSNLDQVGRLARKGSVIVVLSDLIDLPEGALDRIVALGSRGRSLVVVQTLDPDESEFPFSGTMRLSAMEGEYVVETDAVAVRDAYLDAMRTLSENVEKTVIARGGKFVRTVTTEEPVAVVRRIVELLR